MFLLSAQVCSHYEPNHHLDLCHNRGADSLSEQLHGFLCDSLKEKKNDTNFRN